MVLPASYFHFIGHGDPSLSGLLSHGWIMVAMWGQFDAYFDNTSILLLDVFNSISK
jgi:hypothetical protein